jgi:hypothetical protein
MIAALRLATLAIFFLGIAIAGAMLRRRTSTATTPPRLWVPNAAVIEAAPGDLVELMISSNAGELEAAKALLTAHGIDARLLDAHGAALLAFLPSCNARLVVQKADAKRSAMILESVPDESDVGDS